MDAAAEGTEMKRRPAWPTPLMVVLGLACLLPDLPFLGWKAWPAWVGLLLGAAFGLSLGNVHASTTRRLVPRLLAVCVVGLGAAMNLKVVALVGLKGFCLTLGTIAATLAAGLLLGRWLGVRKHAAILVTVGTAICGGSAIAAMAPVLGAEEEDTSLALGTVFLLNAAALLVFPLIGHAFRMSQEAFGLWAALGIHDTSSVVGAASGYGKEALVLATTTKLARALWIVPVTLAVGAWLARRGSGAPSGRAKRPWFVLGFVAAAAVVTFLPALRSFGEFIAAAARRGLVLTLFLIGLGLTRESLHRLGLRPFLLGLLLWLLAGGAALAGILTGLLR